MILPECAIGLLQPEAHALLPQKLADAVSRRSR